MRDKFFNKIMPGDEIVYAVRDGNTAALRYSIVIDVQEDHVKVRSQSGEGPVFKLHFPDRIVSLSAERVKYGAGA